MKYFNSKIKLRQFCAKLSPKSTKKIEKFSIIQYRPWSNYSVYLEKYRYGLKFYKNKKNLIKNMLKINLRLII